MENYLAGNVCIVSLESSFSFCPHGSGMFENDMILSLTCLLHQMSKDLQI